MEIVQYGLEISTDNKCPVLVKEKSFHYEIECLDCPEKIAEMLCACTRLHLQAEEHLYAIMLDNSMHPLAVSMYEIGHGSVNSCPVDARGLFIRALLIGATHIIVAHNHPSGSLDFSLEDQQVCTNLQEAGNLLGIQLRDFIVVSTNGYSSIQEQGGL